MKPEFTAFPASARGAGGGKPRKIAAFLHRGPRIHRNRSLLPPPLGEVVRRDRKASEADGWGPTSVWLPPHPFAFANDLPRWGRGHGDVDSGPSARAAFGKIGRIAMKAEPFVRGLNFGEGIRWHEGRFWYSDFYKHQVWSASPSGDARAELTIDDRPSGLGWLPDGRLLLVAMVSQRVLRREKDGTVVLHADLKGLAKFHTNDMLVDSHGNAFIGCFGFDLDTFIEEKGVE